MRIVNWHQEAGRHFKAVDHVQAVIERGRSGRYTVEVFEPSAGPRWWVGEHDKMSRSELQDYMQTLDERGEARVVVDRPKGGFFRKEFTEDSLAAAKSKASRLLVSQARKRRREGSISRHAGS